MHRKKEIWFPILASVLAILVESFLPGRDLILIIYPFTLAIIAANYYLINGKTIVLFTGLILLSKFISGLLWLFSNPQSYNYNWGDPANMILILEFVLETMVYILVYLSLLGLKKWKG